MTRVVRMNESTSDNFDGIPLPARQQLGYFNETVDKDARSGNGVDALRVDGSDRKDYGSLPVEDGGSRVREVTYHLDTTPAPEEPAGAPGSREYNAAQGRSKDSNVVLETRNNATTARQSDEGYISTQREVPGRNQRMAAALDYDSHASAEAGSGKAANVRTSGSVDDVPGGTTQQVLDWVGDDKDRARQALDKEEKRENPRSGLKAKLEDIAGK
jgi:hypothetical protein